MRFPEIHYEKSNSEGLEERAKKILGLAPKIEVDEEKIKKCFRKKAKKHHPDMNMGEKALDYFKLILEAKNYLKNKSGSTNYLKNEELVKNYLGESYLELRKSINEVIREYEEWRRNQFYDMENESIWPEK